MPQEPSGLKCSGVLECQRGFVNCSFQVFGRHCSCSNSVGTPTVYHFRPTTGFHRAPSRFWSGCLCELWFSEWHDLSSVVRIAMQVLSCRFRNRNEGRRMSGRTGHLSMDYAYLLYAVQVCSCCRTTGKPAHLQDPQMFDRVVVATCSLALR